MKRTFGLVAIFVALVLGAALSRAGENATSGQPDVSGTWQMSVEFSGGGGSPVFTLKQDGENITGRYVGGLGEANVTGSLKGNAISFGFMLGGENEKVVYTGTVEGDTMKGKLTLGSYGDGTFTGKRQKK